MSETKGLVKCVLGFLLSILVIVGGAFGLDVQVNVEDTEPTAPEVVETDKVNETTEEQDVLATTDDVVETEQSTVDSTPTEDEEKNVDDSVETEVAEPTEETKETVTEKGEN